ncbi:MAG: signal recognition particle-docking protein FtsY, partial [Calditrichaeota bacterium]|nr:signal recognition particle-docking protein FtsY [Calditrichota bacterium]
PHEVLIVIDATTGQNGLSQARGFKEASGCTGLIVSKLDGTARGGIIVPIHRELGLPVEFVGLGEGLQDLQPFESKAYVHAILNA